MPWIPRKKRFVAMIVLIGLLAAGVYLFYTELRPVVIFGLRQDFAHAIPFQLIPAGIAGIRAEDCGQCHEEIYKEWKSSIHAHAWACCGGPSGITRLSRRSPP